MTEEMLKLTAEPNGIFLTLLDDGVTMIAVTRFLCGKGVRKYNEKAVEEIVRDKRRTPQKIAERDSAQEKDASIAVQISKDGLSAAVTVEPPFFTKPWPGTAEIEKALEQKNVVFGVDRKAIEDMISLRMAEETVTAARGKPPANGTNARIELLLDPDNVPKADEDTQKVDHRLRSVFVNVRKGDRIAVKHPATEGENGRSVIGSEIKAVSGKDIAFPAGSGVESAEDGLALVAAIDGRLSKKDHKLSVLPELEVPGDVDFSVGNIHFTGSVKIKGAVREGFSVIAAGDIEIREMVEGAHVETTGNIVIQGGIRGMGKGRVVAGGSLKLGFADQAYIRSGSDISVKNAILHSDVAAQHSVTVMGGQKSQIAGGKIQAGVEVVCQTLGSEMGTKTEVIVGIAPEQAERRKELQSTLARLADELEKLDANLGFLKKLEQAGKLDDEKRALMVKVTQLKFKNQATLKSMGKELQELEERLELGKSKGVVRVKDICYPGVSITIRGVVYAVKEAFKFASFAYEDGEVRMRSFDG